MFRGLATKKQLEDLLAEEILEHPGITAQKLHTKHPNYTIQGIYKALGSLVEDGVLIKRKKSYYIYLPWVLQAQNALDEAERNLMSHSSSHTLFLDANNKISWKFTDLLHLNEWWAVILLYLLKQTDSKTLLGWNPHPWFNLAQTKKEEQFIQSFGLAGGHLYLIVGGTTRLDKQSATIWPSDIVTHSSATGPFDSLQNTYINVIGNYVLKVVLDNKTTSRIENIYSSYNAADKEQVAQLVALFYTSCKAKLLVSYSPQEAQKLKNKFSRYWGVDFL